MDCGFDARPGEIQTVMIYAKTTLGEEDKLGANVVECLMCDFKSGLGKMRGGPIRHRPPGRAETIG
jgi:hypothetical protein